MKTLATISELRKAQPGEYCVTGKAAMEVNRQVLKLTGRMKEIAIQPQKRNIESIAYSSKTVLRTRRGVHAKLALMRLEEFLREYGEPGDTGTVYDMATGSLYADCKVTVGKVITHIFRANSR